MKPGAALILVALCALLLTPAEGADKLRVSSFSTILSEIAGVIGADRVIVTAHVKPGTDPHEFEPKPEDLKIVSAAEVILLSAKHMEGYVGKLKEATGTKSLLVEVGDGLGSLPSPGADPQGRSEDPHWWHSIVNTEKAVRIIADALSAARPADRDAFASNAAKYVARLEGLRKWVKSKVAELPRDERKLVTSHDAFQYFARENGFTIYAIEGVSPEDQPSSKRVADLIRIIRAQQVRAVFLENLENPKVLEEITRESGAKIGGALYADGLAESGEAASYEGMYRHNVSTIVDALK